MTRDDFDLVRNNVSAEAAAVQYGLTVNNHKARCPFHNDRTPSLGFHGMRFRCFACDAAGSSIDLTSHLLGVTPAEAVKQLAHDFGISVGATPSDESRRHYAKLQRERETYNDFMAWRDRTLQMLVTCYRLADRALKNGCPDGTEAGIRWQPVIEYWINMLEDNDVDRQVEIFRIRKGVERRCKIILASMSGKSGVA